MALSKEEYFNIRNKAADDSVKLPEMSDKDKYNAAVNNAMDLFNSKDSDEALVYINNFFMIDNIIFKEVLYESKMNNSDTANRDSAQALGIPENMITTLRWETFKYQIYLKSETTLDEESARKELHRKYNKLENNNMILKEENILLSESLKKANAIKAVYLQYINRLTKTNDTLIEGLLLEKTNIIGSNSQSVEEEIITRPVIK